MDLWYYVMKPFTWLLQFFYDFSGSYGVALIFFTLVIKVILFPFSLKGKKSMIQMNMLSGQLQRLQKQYSNNPEKYNEEVQKLYEKENVKPMGGCLWSFLPMFILLPLYAIIRQPMKYMMGMTAEQISTAAKVLGWASYTNAGYNQLYLSARITPETMGAVQAAVGTTMGEIFPVNFSFLGIDLSLVPTPKFWVNGLGWDSIGLFLLPLASVGISMLFSLITSKTNAINNPDSAKMNWGMMVMMAVMYLFFGFSMPGALSVYLMSNSFLGIFQEVISARILKKDYEKAAELRKQRILEEKEEEKRLRREKAEQRAREAEEARKNKGKKKVKEVDEDRISPEVREASRVGIRQYARGRAYDPARFGEVTEYDEAAIENHLTAPFVEKEKKKKGKKQNAEPPVTGSDADSAALSEAGGEKRQDD